MSQKEKRIARLKSKPSDYAYEEAKALLCGLGYAEDNKGSTSGSRVRFYRKEDEAVIDLHKPHQPLKKYQINLLIEKLTENGDING